MRWATLQGRLPLSMLALQRAYLLFEQLHAGSYGGPPTLLALREGRQLHQAAARGLYREGLREAKCQIGVEQVF